MTLVKNAVINSKEIIDYLRNHPDFFLHHPEILSTLNIPHIQDRNISSLIEYQIVKLRDEINILQENKKNLEKLSDINVTFIKKVHDLTLQLFASPDLNELYKCLNKGLKNYYSADRVLLLVFSGTKKSTEFQDMKLLASSSNLNFMFTELFHRNKPLCNSLQEEHLYILFNENHDKIKSTVIVPIVDQNWQGLLVLASHRANRYKQGLEIELLVYIKDILQIMLHKLIN